MGDKDKIYADPTEPAVLRYGDLGGVRRSRGSGPRWIGY